MSDQDLFVEGSLFFVVGGGKEGQCSVRANECAVFCSPPEGAVCLTCGTHLQLGEYGSKPVVVGKKKKKKQRKKGLDEETRGAA